MIDTTWFLCVMTVSCIGGKRKMDKIYYYGSTRSKNDIEVENDIDGYDIYIAALFYVIQEDVAVWFDSIRR